jgi:hypothetical protein
MQQENHPQRVHSNQNPAETNHMTTENKRRSFNSAKKCAEGAIPPAQFAFGS